MAQGSDTKTGRSLLLYALSSATAPRLKPRSSRRLPPALRKRRGVAGTVATVVRPILPPCLIALMVKVQFNSTNWQQSLSESCVHAIEFHKLCACDMVSQAFKQGAHIFFLTSLTARRATNTPTTASGAVMYQGCPPGCGAGWATGGTPWYRSASLIRLAASGTRRERLRHCCRDVAAAVERSGAAENERREARAGLDAQFRQLERAAMLRRLLKEPMLTGAGSKT
jgi:hypothetical protein